ncbi:MAG: hypothetical protein H6684_11870 [Deltaproteobacteria bacterium]|nr:hypothetical protein [Deltaproteobacteria bacterium]MCB9478915.1 hypothetical protein [Deltaproteobacteria bacterium]MCB9489421.1 hypothetical protein [Deltaproteobacteria bacterium]
MIERIPQALRRPLGLTLVLLVALLVASVVEARAGQKGLGDFLNWLDTRLHPAPQELPLPSKTYNEALPAGPLRLKAEEYDLWHRENHQPQYGATVGTQFTSNDRSDVLNHFDYGDSTIWTGTYLASQAFRYYVTGDPVAKDNVLNTVDALDGHLHVTGVPGFIARYRSKQNPWVLDQACETHPRCHLVNSGPYAGDAWWGETSRDQYTGWFYGMSLAYDLVDDEDMRDLIRDDVSEVLDKLISDDWWIRDEEDKPTDAGPNVLPIQQLSWSLVGYHMTGNKAYEDVVKKWIDDGQHTALWIATFSLLNRYSQYYGNNLGHQNFYTLLRLAPSYFGEKDTDYFKDLFEDQQHDNVRLSHNAYFTEIFMSVGNYDPSLFDGLVDPYLTQVVQDLADFRDAPNYKYYVDPTDLPIDPLSETLVDLWEQYPILETLMGGVDLQSLEAHTVDEQCSTDFLWQRSPFRNEACGADQPSRVEPGVDYLVAYWMAAYQGFIDKSY